LHLIAEAPNGSFAAHVAVIYDFQNRRGLYEPVCTHPDHRRKGLSQTLMFELMHRVRAMGALTLTVETGDMAPANALYDTIGFTEMYKSYTWRKML
jgi:mycothiol synthase